MKFALSIRIGNHAADHFIFEMHISPSLILKNRVSSLPVEYPSVPAPYTNTRALTMAGHLSLTPRFPALFFIFPPSGALISGLICPSPLPHHMKPFHWVSSDVYIIEASWARAYTESKSLVSVSPPPSSPNTLSVFTVYGVVSSCLLTCILQRPALRKRHGSDETFE